MTNEELAEKLRVCAGGKCNERDTDGCWTDLMYEAADAIEELTTQIPKWISISEELPKEFHDVLCFTDAYDMFLATYYGLDGDGEPIFDDNNGDYWEGTVIYWMPIPARPEEVNDGSD
jgi:NTP pyrophosphatase (non-canonical NTP hydrolase)